MFIEARQHRMEPPSPSSSSSSLVVDDCALRSSTTTFVPFPATSCKALPQQQQQLST